MYAPLSTLPLSMIRRLLGAALMVALLVLTGCVSSNSNTASYAGPSVSSVSAKRAAARKDVREARREMRQARRELSKLEKQITRDERRIKRKRGSKKRIEAAKKRLRVNKRNLRKTRRLAKRSQRNYDRAKRREETANRRLATAKNRKAEAERRFAAEQRRKAAEEKRREQELAREEVEREDPKPSRRSIFALNDPALKNVNDYGARIDGAFPIAGVPIERLDKRLYRQEVSYRSSHRPGTVVVDPHSRYLYLVMSNNRAMRYGIGVGRAGFEWQGKAYIGWKQKWPKWTPPEEMIARQPELDKWSVDNGGMPGGPTNPLGARALYLFQDGKDTLYRLHGTPQWASIGTAASSGCIRLMNQDVIDLYKRVPNGAQVVVL